MWLFPLGVGGWGRTQPAMLSPHQHQPPDPPPCPSLPVPCVAPQPAVPPEMRKHEAEAAAPKDVNPLPMQYVEMEETPHTYEMVDGVMQVSPPDRAGQHLACRWTAALPSSGPQSPKALKGETAAHHAQVYADDTSMENIFPVSGAAGGGLAKGPAGRLSPARRRALAAGARRGAGCLGRASERGHVLARRLLLLALFGRLPFESLARGC